MDSLGPAVVLRIPPLEQILHQSLQLRGSGGLGSRASILAPTFRKKSAYRGAGERSLGGSAHRTSDAASAALSLQCSELGGMADPIAPGSTSDSGRHWFGGPAAPGAETGRRPAGAAAARNGAGGSIPAHRANSVRESARSQGSR